MHAALSSLIMDLPREDKHLVWLSQIFLEMSGGKKICKRVVRPVRRVHLRREVPRQHEGHRDLLAAQEAPVPVGDALDAHDWHTLAGRAPRRVARAQAQRARRRAVRRHAS